MKVKKFFYFFIFSIFFLGFGLFFVKAEDGLLISPKPDDLLVDTSLDSVKKDFNIFLDHATILKGYTVTAFSDYLKLSLVPGILSEGTMVSIEEIDDKEMELPWNLKKESAILQFEFLNKQAYDDDKPFYIQFSYDKESLDYKQVFFYDKNYNSWRPLPTWDFPQENFVRSLIHLPFARIAVFSYPEIRSVGQASWYRYKGGNFTASTDFPKDSVLRVHNLDNKKFVDVKVNDFGPDRSIFPDRILDLDYEAFKKIANKSDGLINVFIEPLLVKAGNFSQKILIDKGVGVKPEIKSGAAVVLREESGDFLFEKEADKVLPIASLTKIFSIQAYLSEADNKNNLDKVVAYSQKDEDYNHQYFNKWEVARINLNHGDLLSIKDLIYSSLVRSANNTVETLVRLSGLDRVSFIKKINDWAEAKGIKSFKINEPTGLDKDNVSSARDLAILAHEVFQDNLIREASVSPKYSFVSRNDNSLKVRYNSSDLVLNNNYKNFKITASKTGFLDEAGYCLITQAEVKGEKIIVVILKASSREESFAETINLLNYTYYLLNNN